MNMFRNLLTLALVALGLGVWFSDPTTWHWADLGGAYVVDGVRFLGQTKPFSVVVLLVIALGLWMTRQQY